MSRPSSASTNWIVPRCDVAVLDTTFLIDVERRRAGAVDVLESLRTQGATLRVPAAAWMEFLYGLSPRRRAAAVTELEASTTFEAFTVELANLGLRLQAEMADGETSLRWHDIHVAATALHHNEELVSNDRAFDGVKGLARTGWP